MGTGRQIAGARRLPRAARPCARRRREARPLSPPSWWPTGCALGTPRAPLCCTPSGCATTAAATGAGSRRPTSGATSRGWAGLPLSTPSIWSAGRCWSPGVTGIGRCTTLSLPAPSSTRAPGRSGASAMGIGPSGQTRRPRRRARGRVFRRHLFESFLHDGAVVLTGAPRRPGAVVDLLAALGIPLRELSLGRVFDVLVDPAGYNVAYTAEEIPPHNDNAQATHPPSGQVLAMVVNEAAGGDTVLVDGWSVLARLERDAPAAVDVLDAWRSASGSTPPRPRVSPACRSCPATPTGGSRTCASPTSCASRCRSITPSSPPGTAPTAPSGNWSSTRRPRCASASRVGRC